jgi:hypothetical protein
VLMPFNGDFAYNIETGAHEFGHSILVAAADKHWSKTHKGSTNDLQDTIRGADGIQRPPDPQPCDIMIYYDDIDPTTGHDRQEPYWRVYAVPTDVLSWIEICQIEFKEV